MPRLVMFPDLKEKFGIAFSRRHVDRLEHSNQFPKRVPLGTNRVGWVESEINDYLEAKIAAREVGKAR